MAKKENLVFTYGTLRKGELRNSILDQGKYIGLAKLPNFDLYDLGSFPGIRPSTSVVHHHPVVGELYLVDNSLLHYLDAIEGYHPERIEESLFVRSQVEVELENGETVEAAVYIFHLVEAVRSMRQIISGDYCARRKNFD